MTPRILREDLRFRAKGYGNLGLGGCCHRVMSASACCAKIYMFQESGSGFQFPAHIMFWQPGKVDKRCGGLVMTLL